MKEIKSAEAIITQKPVKVSLCCPYCDYENEYTYAKFCVLYANPCDWDWTEIKCEECGLVFQIQGQDWQ